MLRHLVVVSSLAWAVPLLAQQGTGSVTGKVTDATTDQAIPGVEVAIPGTPYRTQSRADGSFRFDAPAGAQHVRATRIGYGPGLQDVTVTAGGTVTVNFTMAPAAALLEEVVVTGYGTQRREAITGSVAAITAEMADVGVVSNVNNMLSGRAAGLNVTLNSGEPGAGSQVLIRGGTSLSASNEPLYVIDGVQINNVQSEASGIGVGGGAQLARNPLNMINPSDIASITVLKDAAAAAIYGSRGANGVILIETKKGGGGTGAGIEYDGYVATASPSRYLDVLNGDQYRAFVQQQVTAGNLNASQLAGEGTANTDWERAITRSSYTHNHDLSFSGGTQDTRYRASLNYMKQEGVLLSSGLERIQARLNATHNVFDNRVRFGLNVTTSHVYNDYVSHQNTGGFEGDVIQNAVAFNPTRPVQLTDSTGKVNFYEIGPGSQSVRNPVAMANQLQDFGHDTRTLGNVSAEVDLFSGLTAQVNVGGDRSSGLRQIYFPNQSPIGAPDGGRAQQSDHNVNAITLQTLLTLRQQGTTHSLDMVGGYEYEKYNTEEFVAEGKGYVSDAFSFNNLAGASVLVPPTSFLEERKYVSFFGRANYGFKDRYFLTGVLRYDGASQFGTGHKWGLFPALSASWHVHQGGSTGLPDLKVRLGWGLQGNPAVPAYSSLLKLEPSSDGRAVWGQSTVVSGVVPTQNANPDLKWEQTSQINGAVDFNAFNNRVSGTVEYYVKNTKDLLLDVSVPPPAPVGTRLENVGKTSNRGIEVSLDVLPISKRSMTWRAGIAFAANRNKVDTLGPYKFITTGGVSGQGQSNQVSQRIIPGQPIGTFYGPVFVGWDAAGKQLFQCAATTPGCTNGQTTSPAATDYAIIGNANPDFTLGINSQINAGRFDASFLVNSWIGNDVFNNTALVYSTKSNALQDKNFLAAALTDSTGIHEPAIYSSRWIESGSFVRLQNVTVGYTFHLPGVMGGARTTRVYLSADNLLLLTGYSGYDPEVITDSGLASRGIDYLAYPHPRTFTAGVHVAF